VGTRLSGAERQDGQQDDDGKHRNSQMLRSPDSPLGAPDGCVKPDIA
jgi:hypothetical protein